MPKFAVVLLHEVTENLTIEVTAKDADTAEDTVQAQIEKFKYDADKLATFYKATWESDTDEMPIDNVDEV